MDIKIGSIGSEVTFHYVNVLQNKIRPNSEHVMISGTVKMQQAVSTYRTYDLDFLCLTKTEKNSLLDVFDLAGDLNLQLENEDYLEDHTVKFRNPFSSRLSSDYPGYYEVIATCVEVGS